MRAGSLQDSEGKGSCGLRERRRGASPRKVKHKQRHEDGKIRVKERREHEENELTGVGRV